MADEILRTNCPRDCYDGCGIWVRRRDGEILSVRGDPEHPISRGSLCPKCSLGYNGAWRDPAARLLHPLRRRAGKGTASFERVSWDTALGEIAGGLQRVAAELGPEAIVHTHYSGTLSLLGYVFPLRFFHRLGATEVEPDTICNMAGHVAWGLLYGTSAVGFDPRTSRDAETILVWGANPSHSAPHMHEHWLGEFSGKVIVVDPIRTETAAAADLHLQPFPGSDAALAFSLLHVLERDGHFDDAFLRDHCLGGDELRPLLASCDPAWGEAQTGIPAGHLEAAAAQYGAGPALLWAGQGLQRQPSGGNVMRAVGLLPAVTGNVGKAGAGFYYLNSTPSIAGVDFGWLAGASLLRGRAPKLSHMGLAKSLENSNRFGAFLAWNTNPVASAPQPERLRRALLRDEVLTVAIDCFMTDTADCADWVLPAASFLEYDDLTYSYMNLMVGVQSKAQEPLGESLPNAEIFRRLAAAMGFEEPELFAPDRELIASLLEQMKLGLDFEALQERGSVFLSPEPLQLHESLHFDTPSGKIEIASEAAEAQGFPRLPQPWSDRRPEAGRFRLLSPASKWRLNDSFANDPGASRQAGAASITLHPQDAQRSGIAAGDRVRVHNEAGALELEARVEAVAPPGVALAYKGRWPRLERSGANVNRLHAGRPSDMGESSAVHGVEVQIEPVA